VCHEFKSTRAACRRSIPLVSLSETHEFDRSDPYYSLVIETVHIGFSEQSNSSVDQEPGSTVGATGSLASILPGIAEVALLFGCLH
jgi:hypothetical protein